MNNKYKLLLLAYFFLLLSLLLWPALIISVILFRLYLHAKMLEESAPTGPLKCPDCQSRRYLVFPRRSKMRFLKLRFTKCSVTEFRCQDCQFEWIIYEVEDYQ